MSKKETLTTAQAAAIIGCHVRTVTGLLREGKLKGKREPGSRGPVWRVDPRSVFKFAEKTFDRGCPRGLKRTKRKPK